MEFQERRQTPRVVMSPVVPLCLYRRLRVRVLDISASGVLIACEDALELNTTGRLQFVLDGQPCETSLLIVRQHAENGSANLFGAAIVGADEVNRKILAQFLERA